ncbi:MAG: ATP-binding protein [Candidatus Latescibacterota bacterium]
MDYIPRAMEPELRRALEHFPALLLTGPRRAGKTTLLRHAFPHASYHLVEDPDVVGRVRADPRSFLAGIRLPAILDEIQNVPEILNYVRARIDADPEHAGQWLLTASHEAALMGGVTESMAGRAAVFQLQPLSVRETAEVSLLRGGFPEVLAHREVARICFASYVQTYLERDVRGLSAIRDLATFRRFLAVLASRIGQILNKTDLAAPLGVSVPTVACWLSILEVTGQILLLPPFYESFGKRLIKSPKVYFLDSGLACHLLGIEGPQSLASSPFLGGLFEGYAAAEIVKQQINAGRRREVYYFRDQQGLEVDFVVPAANHRLLLIEAKAGQTVTPAAAQSLLRLSRAVERYDVARYAVHQPPPALRPVTALCPGVSAVAVEDLLNRMAAGSA